MKNIKQQIRILFGLVTIICIQIASCQTSKDSNCILINKPIEIQFQDSALLDICFSPFENGKVWVRLQNKNYDILEINTANGQQRILDKEHSQYFYTEKDEGRIRYYHEDQFDSLIWIGGPNKNVVYYDQRTKLIHELPVRYVTRIISKPREVFFVSLQGFCYWDRKTKSILQVSGIPPEFIQSSVMPNDSTIILDAKYIYYFKSKQVKTGAFFDKYEHNGEWFSYRAHEGVGLFSKNDSLWYFYKSTIGKLPLPYIHIDNTKISNQKYWQSDNNFYYSFDPKSNVTKKYAYRLPNVNNYSIDYQVDSKYIWVKKPGQVMLISLLDNKQLEFPIHSEDGHIRTILDGCNTYSIYKNKLLFASKEDFIKMCLPFDAKQYELNLKQFNAVIDSIGLMKDTITAISLAKLNYLKEVYSKSDHIEIIQKLDALNYHAFQNVKLAFPDGYLECYENKALPLSKRTSCLISLLDQYGRLSNFKMVLHLENEYIKKFGAIDRNTYSYYFSAVDSTKRYLFKIDSLQKLGLAEDSLYFFKAMALETICLTRWYCHEGCGGCDFSIVSDKLKPFPKKFPHSNLSDNVEFYLENENIMYGYEDDESLITINKKYEIFLKKHPNTDLKANIQLIIFENLISMYAPNKSEINLAASRFIREFPNDKRIADVKRRLNDLNNK